MYESFFHLRERPFAAAGLLAARFFPAKAMDLAHKTLSRCIDRAEGAGLAIGPTGVGKTLLCQVLARDFGGRFSVAQLLGGQLGTRRAMMQAILYELGMPFRGLDEGELRLLMIDHLSGGKQTNEGLLLLVDEAHTLPVRLLDELRMITNIARDGRPRVRLVLVGGPQLEERFASPKLDAFNQRLAARCYLESLSGEETAAYVRAQITAVGGDSQLVFTAESLEAIHRASDGVPRLINQVCDHAMILAQLGGQRPITGSTIEEAWADLQQLPAPWNSREAHSDNSKVVEFGTLDEPAEPTAIRMQPLGQSSELAFEGGDAEQRLAELEDHLAELEDDFRPAGSIGPELELNVDVGLDPFGEFFEEEEVVIDRYAALESDIFGQRPAVTNKQDTELPALLAPLATKPAAPTLSLAAIGGSIMVGPKASAPAPEVVDRSPSNDRWEAAPAARTETKIVRTEAIISKPAVEPLVKPAKLASPPSLPAEDDSDLIVIEDEQVATIKPQSAGQVKRQEYSQLFAKLRRG